MKILGIDPGTARVGWGIVEENKGKIVAGRYGCIETKSTLSAEKRLKEIFDVLLELLRKEKPDALALEEIFFATNAKTVIPVAQGRGVVLLAAAQASIPVVSYTPLVVKQTITGNGKAEKSQVQRMVMRLLNLSRVPKPDDAADALAIALTHAYSYRLKNKTL
ncbi:crossover junction endodeoxyribonuclease RuvC [Candidatus Gottesmanbacteria bacterium]|nr:crossover junction endodeoxyribonuclease RuvC [Candidatus Gottesmanbacteria bacterium]